MTFEHLKSKPSGRRGSVIFAAVAAFALTLSACSSPGSSGTDTESPGSENSGSTEETLEITAAVGASVPLFSAPYLAQSLGYFEDENLDVTLMENSGPNTANFMVAGDADIALWTAGVPIMLTLQGRQAVQLQSTTGISTSSDLVGGEGIETIEDLRGGRIATLAMGTATYGSAVYYNDMFNLDAEIVVFPDNQSIQAALASGQVQGATGVHVNLSPLVDSGRAVSLINSHDTKQLEEIWGIDYPIGGWWTLEANLAEKRPAMVRFLRAIDRAYAWMEQESPETVAAELHKNEAFQAVPLEQLAGLVEAVAPLLHPQGGVLEEDSWNFALDRFEEWGLDGYDRNSPLISFDGMVDGSLLAEAQQ